MHPQEREDHERIGAVVLGPGGREGGAEARAGRRMHRIDRQPRILQQRVQQGVAPGLDGQGHGLASVRLAECFQPRVQRFGVGFDLALFNALRAGRLPGEGVRFVSPVQGHEGRIVFVFHGGFWFGGTGLQFVSCEASGDAGS
jgi:hypothetical protein